MPSHRNAAAAAADAICLLRLGFRKRNIWHFFAFAHYNGYIYTNNNTYSSFFFFLLFLGGLLLLPRCLYVFRGVIYGNMAAPFVKSATRKPHKTRKWRETWNVSYANDLFRQGGGMGWAGQVGVWDSVWFDRPFLCKRTRLGWVRALMAPSGDRSGNSAFEVHNIYAHGLFNIFRSGSWGAIWWERGWVSKKGNIQSWQWWQTIPYQIPLTNIPDLTSYPINVNLYTYFHI